MANRTLMLEQLASVFEEEQAQVLAAVIYDSYNDLVRRDDFSDLKVIVREIAETQQRTDQHLVEIAETQQRTDQHLVDLAAAQQRTEQRVEELGEAQQRTDQHVGDLAEAQQRTEEAQQRTEQRVGDLAEAQQRTEYAVQHLAREVGGLSNRMGGDLEDVAAIVIEDALTRELGWQVDELSRVWQTRDGVDEEIDIFGKAHDPSRPDTSLWIVGEVKFNLTMRDVERFSKLLERAAAHLDGEIVPVCFCYRIRPAVQEKLLEEGYRLVLSNGRMPK
jgi:Tfp pilus assembly protein PilE